MEIHIFRNKVIVTIFSDKPVSTVYENENVREGFIKQFEMLWNIAKY